MLITPAYTAIFGLVFVILSARTLLLRREFGIAIGGGDNLTLARAARVHANFAEYVPISLILIYFWEIQNGSNLWIHGICTLLLIGRILHAFGVSKVNEDGRYRMAGIALTFIVIITISTRLLASYISI